MKTESTRTLRRPIGRAPDVPSEPAFAIDGRDGRVAIRGTLDIHGVTEAERILKRSWDEGMPRTLDLASLDHLDTPGALLLCSLRKKDIELTGVRAEHRSLLDLIGELDLKPLPKPPAVSRAREFVTQLGKAADEAWRDTLDVIAFVGRTASAVGYALAHPVQLLIMARAGSRKRGPISRLRSRAPTRP